tara:strand:+ start:285 stop:668 length:384 start_codon:yes stop_codon:yes gene_type:complete
MPRLPVDGKKVIEHRITFGTKERQILEGGLGAYQFNKIATPVVDAMSDVSFWVTLAFLLSLVGIIIENPFDNTIDNWRDAVITGVMDYRKARETEGLRDDVSALGNYWLNFWLSTVPGARSPDGQVI